MPGWLLPTLRGYRPAWLRGDVVAGLTVWAVLVPEALAYASIAGVSPVVGLYAAIPALILYPLFGSSRHLVVGPMSATAALSAGVVADIAAADGADYAELTAALAIAVGVVALVAGLLRLGFLAQFISEPVLKGFIVGMALVIIVGQLPKLFGVEGGEGNVFEQTWSLITSLDDTNGATLLIGTVCLALVLVLRRVAPLVPGSLVAVVVGIAAVGLFGLEDRGVAIVGEVESGLPAIGLPGVGTGDVALLLSGAFGIMLVGFAEGLGAAKTYAQRNGYRIEPNRELLGLGAANVGAGLTSGMVVNGSLSKTAVNGGAGARSQVSGLVVAVLTVVTLLFLTGLFEELPESALAAVVIAAVIELVDVPALRRLFRVSTARLSSIYGHAARADFICALGALLGVLVFGTLPGLAVGIGLSLVLLLYRASRPHVAVLGRVPGGAPGTRGQWADVERHPGNLPQPGVAVLRVESGIFFANADTVHERIRAAATDARAVVLDCSTVPVVDVTAADMLRDAAEELERDGRRLLVVRDIGQVRDVLRQAGDTAVLDHVFTTIDEAAGSVERPTTSPTNASRNKEES